MVPAMLNILVDTNVIGALAKREFPASLVDFQKVLGFRKAGKLQLWVSSINEAELQAISDNDRYYHELIFMLIDNISVKATVVADDMKNVALGVWPLSVVRKTHPMIGELEQLIPESQNPERQRSRSRDIAQLYQCYRNNLDAFWTEDQSTILNYAEQLLNLGIKVLSTRDLVAFIEKQ